MKRIVTCLIFGLTFVVANTHAQVAARVHGLEDNEEYMSLLVRERMLKTREDSLVGVISYTRQLFSSDAQNRELYGDAILRLEDEIFEVRNALGLTAGSISSIEQTFVIDNLDSASDNRIDAPPAHASANLVMNRYFRDNLSPADHAALIGAQLHEMYVDRDVRTYIENYAELRNLKDAYDAVDAATAGDSISRLYTELEDVNGGIAARLAGTWQDVFDNKVYAYIYLLEKMDRRGELDSLENRMLQAREMKAQKAGKYVSDELTGYKYDKKLIFDCELLIADMLGLKSSADSLGKAAAAFDRMSPELPALDFKERVFIDYMDVKVTRSPEYNAQNPIPEVTVYSNGVVFRILIGAYTRQQPVSMFRNASPLAYDYAHGKYNYYAGAYGTLEKAEEGVAELKRIGFRAPEIVRFTPDGTSNITRSALEEQKAGVMLRIEISGTDALSAAVRATIDEMAPDKDVARSVGGDGRTVFIISSFDSRITAGKLAEAIAAAQNDIDLKIVEIDDRD